MLNETHNPALVSWLAAAHDGDTDFTIQNLPFAVFRRASNQEVFRCGVAIGDQVIDLAAVASESLFHGDAGLAVKACTSAALNPLMAMGEKYWSSLRLALSRGLRVGASEEAALARCLVPMDQVEYALPCEIGDYTDYYTSIHHATNVGSLFRPDNPLLPNYKWIPIGYHGRSSSIQVSGHDFTRPRGQLRPPTAEEPYLGPSQKLDYELEVAIYIGAGNTMGSSIAIDSVDQHVFGLGLLNDWSARDIQAWEYQPLGPFLAKNFASTVSPWVVTLEALAPYRAAWQRDAADPQPLPYLSDPGNSQWGAFDIDLQVGLVTQTMAAAGEEPVILSNSNFKDSYWTVAQMVAHHTVGGCNLRPGDLFGSGTQSGPSADSVGSMLELSAGGKQPVALPNGEQRTFLQDGDCVILRGRCQAEGLATIGFGECRATVMPQLAPDKCNP